MAAVTISVLVLLTAMSGALFKPGPWYETLQKPSWTPPNWAFPTVWTVLYVMIAYAGWDIWTKAGLSLAMTIWIVQLILNGCWSWFFFGMKRMDLALVDVGALWLVIASFIVVAWPISTLAALLFVPYLLWVTAAGLLNFSVLRLNAVD